MRKKREFLFDDKELYALGLLTVIIFVLVFTLGVMVGQTLEEQSVASPLTSNDSLAGEGLETMEGEFSQRDTVLTDNQSGEEAATARNNDEGFQRSYYQELPNTDTYVEVEVTPAGQVISAKPAPAKESEGNKQQFKPIAQKEEASQQTIQEETPVPPSANPATDVPSQKVAMVPALPSVPKTPDDEFKFGRQTTSPDKSSPLSGMIYSVQVASSPNREDSERLQQKYGQLGFLAYIMTADLGEKGIWYRVRVGNLQSQQEAEALRDELIQKAPKLTNKPFIIKVTEE